MKPIKQVKHRKFLYIFLPAFALLTSCDSGFQFSHLVDHLIQRLEGKGGAGDIYAAKETYLATKQCFEAHQPQFLATEGILAKVSADHPQCFSDKVYTDTLRRDAQGLISELSGFFARAKLKPSEVKLAAEKLEALSKKYNELQSSLTHCRTKAFLEMPPSPQVTDEKSDRAGSLLLHTTGDIFGLNTGKESYEGNQPENTLGHRLAYLKSLKTLTENNRFVASEAQADPCKGIAHLPFAIENVVRPDFSLEILKKLIQKNEVALSLSQEFASNNVERLRTELKAQVEGLQKPGESVFVTAVWKDPPHAFLYQFLKEDEDGNYTFKIINSGLGIETYHAQATKGFEVQYLPFVEVTNLKKDQVLRYTFLKALIETRMSEKFRAKPEDLYERVMFELGGMPSKNVYDAGHFKAPQQAGTCSYFSQPWILEQDFDQMKQSAQMAEQSFFPRQIELLIGLKTLRDTTEKWKSTKLPYNHERLSLVEKSVVFISGDLLNAAKEQAVDPGVMRAALDVEGNIRSDLKDVLQAQALPKPTDVFTATSSALAAGGSVALPSGLVPADRIDVKGVALVGKTFFVLDAKQIDIDKDFDGPKLLAELNTANAALNFAAAAGQYQQILAYAQSLAPRLTLERIKKSALTQDEASSAINEFAKIQHTYTYSLLKAMAAKSLPKKRLTLSQLLTTLKWLTLGDVVNQNFVPSPKKLPTLFQPRFYKMMGDLATTEALDARFHNLLAELRVYWESQAGRDNSFFDFEELPAGVSSDNFLRRVMFDTSAQFRQDDEHWSDRKPWKDVDWAAAWIQQSPTYAAWLAAERTASETPGDPKRIEHFRYRLEPSEGFTISGSFNSQPFPMTKPNVERVRDDIMVRRQALQLLAADREKLGPMEDSLPQSFFDLRQMSYYVDFLLTAPIGSFKSAWLENERFRLEMNPVRDPDNFQIGYRYAQYTGETAEFDTFKLDTDSTGNWIWKPTKTIANYLSQTTYKGAQITTKIFGLFSSSGLKPRGYSQEEQKEETKRASISPYVHLQNGVIPFYKYADADIDATRSDAIDLFYGYMDGAKPRDASVTYTTLALNPKAPQNRRRLTPNELVTKDPARDPALKQVQSMTLERLRAFLTLSSKKSVQLIETLAFFSKYDVLLGREAYQQLFEKLMLEPNLLLEELVVSQAESAQFVKKLTDFCKERYAAFKTGDNLKGLAFVLRMNQLFRLQVKYAIAHKNLFKVADTLADEFLDTPKLLDELAQIKILNDDQKALFYRALASSFAYVESFTLDEIKYLLTAMGMNNALGVKDKKWDDIYIKSEMENLLPQKQAQIQQALSDPARRNTILNAVAQRIDPTLASGAWQPKMLGALPPGHEPETYEEPVQKIEFNVVTASLYKNGLNIVKMPFSSDDLEKAFGDLAQPMMVTKIGRLSFAWKSTDKKGNTIWIKAQRRAGGIDFQQSADNINWFQLMDEDDVKAFSSARGFFQGFDHWQQVDVKGPSTTIKIFNQGTKAQAFTTTVATGSLVTDVVRTKDNLTLAILADDDPGFRPFDRIEAPSSIEIWLNTARIRQEVALPRFDLQFKPISAGPDAGKLDCATHTKHRLADVQFSRTLQGPKNYLICEPRSLKTGVKRLALMPLQKLTGEEKLSSLSDQFTINRDLDNARWGSQIMLIYELPSLDSKGEELLQPIKPLDDAALYYLALRRWWTHDYKSARTTLLSGSFDVSRLSSAKGELRILQWLFEGRPDQGDEKDPKEIQDTDPRAGAIRLMAAAILISQMQDHKIGAEFFQQEKMLKKLQILYLDYLRNINVISDEWLDFYQEWTIAEFLDENKQANAAITNRILSLKYLHPSRFESQEAVTKYRADIGQHGGQQAVYEKKDFSKTDYFESFDKIADGQSSPPALPKSLSVLDAIDIFTPRYFGLLYNIAVGAPFDRAEAIKLLESLLKSKPTETLNLSALSDHEIRLEFQFLFSTSSLIKKPTKEDPTASMPNSPEYYEMARFLELITKSFGAVPSWEDFKNRRAQYNLFKQQADVAWTNFQDAQKQGRPLSEIDNLRTIWSILHNKQHEIPRDFNSEVSARMTAADRLAKCFRGTFKPGFEWGAREPLKSSAPSTQAHQAEDLFGQKPIDPMKEPYLSQARLAQLFDQVALSQTEKELIADDAKSLNQVFDLAMTGPAIIQKSIGELKSKITNYAQKEMATRAYRVKDKLSIKALGDEIKNKLAETQRTKDNLHKQILETVHGHKGYSPRSIYTRLLRLAQAEKTPDIDDLLYVLLTRKLSSLQQAAIEPKDKSELQSLAADLLSYLFASTYGQHLKDCSYAIDELYRALDTGKNAGPQAQKAVALLEEVRHYDAEKRLEYLIFEHFMGIHIRKLQVEALDKLDIRDGKIHEIRAMGAVLEMIMGFGKTSVLTPLFSAMLTEGQWLNIIVLPEALVASMSRELGTSIRKSFNRKVQVLTINRQSDLSAPSLMRLYDRLVRARNEGITIITTGSSILSLFLSFIDVLGNYPADPVHLDAVLTEFIRIYSYTRKYGVLTIDEVDMALDVLKANQFSTGQRMPIDRAITASIFAFYQMLATNPDVHQSVTLPFLRYSKGPPLSDDAYVNLKPKLVDKMINNPNFFATSYSLLDRAYKQLIKHKANQDLLKKYWTNVDAQQSHADLFRAIDTQFPVPAEASLLKSMAGAIYDELTQIFMLTASKKLHVHYDRLPQPIKFEDELDEDFNSRLKAYEQDKFIAIPSHAGQPAINSRFGVVEAVNYTMQLSIEEPRFVEQVWLEIDSIKALVTKAANPLDVARKFNRLISVLDPADRPASLGLINEDTVKAIAQKLRNKANFDVGMDLINSYTLPQLKTYSRQLHTNGQIYGSLFRIVSGFSGTLWSIKTFPGIFIEGQPSDTEEKTFYLLWREYRRRLRQDASYQAVRIIDEDSLDPNAYLANLVKAIYADWPNAGSLLDQGGMLRGFDNFDVAQQIAKNVLGPAGIVFYDDRDQITVLDKDTGATTLIANTAVPQNQRLVYWDKKHTTGSDVKVRPTMTARMIFDQHTSSRDAQQTVWRLRGLAEEQRIDQYLAMKGDLNLIKTKMIEGLNIPASALADFSPGLLMLYAKASEIFRLADLIHRSIKHKISTAVAKEPLNVIFSEGTTNARAAQIYQDFSPLFERKLDKPPYTYMGIPASFALTPVVLDKDKDAVLSPAIKLAIERLSSVVPNAQAVIDREIAQVIKIGTPLLPNDLRTSQIETGLEVEIEQEIETQTQTQLEQQIEQYQFDAKNVAHVAIQWNPGKYFAKNYITPISMPITNTKSLQAGLESRSINPTFTFSDALKYAQGGKFQKLGAALTKNLLGSLNFAPVHYRNADQPIGAPRRYEVEFFSTYYKDITDVLVVLDNTGDDAKAEVRVVALDLNDVEQLTKILRDDVKAPDPTKQVKLALYSLEQGLFRQGNDRINADALEKNQTFIEIMAQLKFLNGDLFYSAAQKTALKNWLLNNNPDEMLKVFKGSILNIKQDSREQMPNSDIRDVFDSLSAY